MLATGAAISIVTEQLAAIIGICDPELKESLGAAGKRMKILLGKVQTILIGESKVEDVLVGIMPELPKCIGQGVIGYNFLKKNILTINYPLGVLTISSAKKPADQSNLPPGYIPFRIAKPDRPLLLIDVLVNNLGTYPFILDTGASQTVVSSLLAQQMGIKVNRSHHRSQRSNSKFSRIIEVTISGKSLPGRYYNYGI